MTDEHDWEVYRQCRQYDALAQLLGWITYRTSTEAQLRYRQNLIEKGDRYMSQIRHQFPQGIPAPALIIELVDEQARRDWELRFHSQDSAEEEAVYIEGGMAFDPWFVGGFIWLSVLADDGSSLLTQ